MGVSSKPGKKGQVGTGLDRDVLVFDGVIEHRGQAVEDLANRRWPERHSPATPVIADVGPFVERFPKLSRLAQEAGLEVQAQLAIDSIDREVAEEGEEVPLQPPAVVVCRALGDWPIAENAVDLGLQPPGGVVGEERDPTLLPAGLRQDWLLWASPNTQVDLCFDVAQFSAGGLLLPATTTSAGAASPFMQDQPLSAPVDTESEVEGAGAVGENPDLESACAPTTHQARIPLN